MQNNDICCPFPTKVGPNDLSRSFPAWAVLGYFGSVIQFVFQQAAVREGPSLPFDQPGKGLKGG